MQGQGTADSELMAFADFLYHDVVTLHIIIIISLQMPHEAMCASGPVLSVSSQENLLPHFEPTLHQTPVNTLLINPGAKGLFQVTPNKSKLLATFPDGISLSFWHVG